MVIEEILKGYKEALEEFDARIPEIIESMNDDDILIINADHGNDPTYKGTDHTREYIPLLVYGKEYKRRIKSRNKKKFCRYRSNCCRYIKCF